MKRRLSCMWGWNMHAYVLTHTQMHTHSRQAAVHRSVAPCQSARLCPSTHHSHPLPHPAEPNVSIQHVVAASDQKWLALAPSFSLSLSLRRGRKLIESDGFPRLLACGLLTEQDRRKGRRSEWEGRGGGGRRAFWLCFYILYCHCREYCVLSQRENNE